MRIRTANSILLAALLSISAGYSQADVPLKSKAYECEELQRLVADKERVYLKGIFGSKSSVYASSSSCHYLHEVPIKSAWKTKDVFSCVVGYRCLSRVDLEDSFGSGE